MRISYLGERHVWASDLETCWTSPCEGIPEMYSLENRLYLDYRQTILSELEVPWDPPGTAGGRGLEVGGIG